MYSFHESLIPLLSIITLPDAPVVQFNSVISCVSESSALPFEKFHFDTQSHLSHLHISSVSFPLLKK